MNMCNLGGERSFRLVASIVTSLTWLDARDPRADVKIGQPVALGYGRMPARLWPRSLTRGKKTQ